MKNENMKNGDDSNRRRVKKTLHASRLALIKETVERGEYPDRLLDERALDAILDDLENVGCR